MPASWSRVEGLKGHTIKTIKGAPFTIERVTANTATIRIGSSAKTAVITRVQIEQAMLLKSPHSRLAPSAVRSAGISEWTPAYVAGIVNAIS